MAKEGKATGSRPYSPEKPRLLFEINYKMSKNFKTPMMVLLEYAMKKNITPEYYLRIESKKPKDLNSEKPEERQSSENPEERQSSENPDELQTLKNPKEFYFKVDIAGISATGRGRSKQVAKQNAALNALEKLVSMKMYDLEYPPIDFEPNPYKCETDNEVKLCVNFVGFLQECCAHNKIPQPLIRQVSDIGPPHCRQFTYECKISSLTTQSTENTKKQAKQMAAKLMIERIMNIIPNLEMSNIKNKWDQTFMEIFEEGKKKTEKDCTIIDNKAKIVEFPNCLKGFMRKKNLRINDFKELLKEQNEHGLKNVLDKLGLQHELIKLQDNPVVIALNINVNTTFTVLVKETSEDTTREELFKQTMLRLNSYINAIN